MNQGVVGRHRVKQQNEDVQGKMGWAFFEDREAYCALKKASEIVDQKSVNYSYATSISNVKIATFCMFKEVHLL